MRKEIIIRVHAESGKGQTKAMKVAAAVRGVESVTLAGGDKSLLLVIGEGVDSNKLTKKLKEKVGGADLVELRTLDTFEAAAFPLGGGAHAHARGSKEMAAARSSPYHNNGNGQVWQYSYTPSHSPYAYHYYPSPMAAGGDYGYGYGYGGYGAGMSSYSRAVARSHPANYSPLVERHDYQRMDRPSSTTSSSSKVKTTMAVPRRESHGHCCVIM